jgi:hypothetical protein
MKKPVLLVEFKPFFENSEMSDCLSRFGFFAGGVQVYLFPGGEWWTLPYISLCTRPSVIFVSLALVLPLFVSGPRIGVYPLKKFSVSESLSRSRARDEDLLQEGVRSTPRFP